uniref:Uncharacterized protein n=1 Tax=viral metagenome TaxID=1070528 RepID=A0A6M3KXR0_9ZZZZ
MTIYDLRKATDRDRVSDNVDVLLWVDEFPHFVSLEKIRVTSTCVILESRGCRSRDLPPPPPR